MIKYFSCFSGKKINVKNIVLWNNMGYLMRYHGSSSGKSLTAEHLANQDYEMWAHVQWPGEGWVKVCDSFSAKGPANLQPLSN